MVQGRQGRSVGMYGEYKRTTGDYKIKVVVDGRRDGLT
jgi:hypothetical protein